MLIYTQLQKAGTLVVIPMSQRVWEGCYLFECVSSSTRDLHDGEVVCVQCVACSFVPLLVLWANSVLAVPPVTGTSAVADCLSHVLVNSRLVSPPLACVVCSPLTTRSTVEIDLLALCPSTIITLVSISYQPLFNLISFCINLKSTCINLYRPI